MTAVTDAVEPLPADGSIEEFLARNPLRLYTPQETRQIIFGYDVPDEQRPTVFWLKKEVRAGRIDCTRLGKTIYFSADDIRALLQQCARGPYGLHKFPRKRGKR